MAQNAFRTLLEKTEAWAKSSDLFNTFVYDTLNASERADLSPHERFVADRVAVETYAEAVRRHVGPDDTVLDVGTGTGILAMVAAEQGARVHAIDHSDIISVAERAATHHGFTEIEFHRIHSRDFSVPDGVDRILHRQFGDDLFDETLLETIVGLKRRLLRDDGTILPAQFDLFLEPVTLDDADSLPRLPNTSAAGYTFDFLQGDPVLEAYKPDDYGLRTLDRESFDTFLTTPEPLLSVDLDRLNTPEAIPSSITTSRRVTTPGRLDGLCLYFRVRFDDELEFSTAPDQPRTHWHNTLFRTPRRSIEAGETIEYTVTMPVLEDTSRWTVSFERTDF